VGLNLLGSSAGSWRCIQEIVEFLLGLLTFIAIAFLQFTDHFLRLTLNLGNVVVGKLLSAGADVNARTSTGWTALKEAQLRGHKNIADCLIQAGAVDYLNGSRQ